VRRRALTIPAGLLNSLNCVRWHAPAWVAEQFAGSVWLFVRAAPHARRGSSAAAQRSAVRFVFPPSSFNTGASSAQPPERPHRRMPHDTPLIATIVIGLTLAFAFGAVAQRPRVSPLVGYLLAGIAVGPNTPGFVADQSLANELAEIGIILLMFGVGLHFSLKDLLSVRAIAIPGAIAQIGAGPRSHSRMPGRGQPRSPPSLR
jgi:hypothetical protein